MIVGPIIRYEDFLRISDEENICFDKTNVAAGVRLFCLGIIKRVAVGAVLYEMYDVFFGLFYDTPNLLVTVFILITVYFATFFTIAGYIDIGVGLSKMYGLSLETYVVADPFRASTFTVYFGNLFTGLSLWIDDHLIRPILSQVGEDKKRLSSLIRAVCYGAVSILFIRSTPSMIALSVPVIIFFYLAFRYRLDERLASRTGLRTVMTLITMLAVAVVWVFIMLGDPRLIVGYLEEMTGEGSEYRMDQILSTFSSMKYLFVMIIAGLTMWVSRIEAYMRAPELSEQKVYPAAQYISFSLILVIFSFTVVFFMPQFEMYDLVPFSRLFI
jgi:D-alanyl-lipoteichoic acid acyltransferase DltB (MBOAT superfamily)